MQAEGLPHNVFLCYALSGLNTTILFSWGVSPGYTLALPPGGMSHVPESIGGFDSHAPREACPTSRRDKKRIARGYQPREKCHPPHPRPGGTERSVRATNCTSSGAIMQRDYHQDRDRWLTHSSRFLTDRLRNGWTSERRQCPTSAKATYYSDLSGFRKLRAVLGMLRCSGLFRHW